MAGFGLNARTFWVWFGGLWLGVGLILLTAGIWLALTTLERQERFEAGAERTQGTVLTKYVRRSNSSGSSTSSTRHYGVTYRFTTPDETVIEGDARLDTDLWDRLEEQGPIAIEYLSDDPGINRIAGDEDGLVEAVIFPTVGGVFTLLGGFVFVRGVGQVRRHRRLLRDGVLTSGTVVEVRPTKVRINRIPQYALSYRYQDHAGRTYVGRSGLLSPEAAAAWAPGASGPVRYERQRPQVSLWVGGTR